MVAKADPRDPWRDAPVGELQEQLLPRWFVVLVLVTIPLAVAAAIAAFTAFGPDEVPVAARRPPPGPALTHDVGAFHVGDSESVRWEDACPLLLGVRIAGTVADRAALAAGLEALCEIRLPQEIALPLRDFAGAEGVVRFAQFEATGVDSAAQADPLRVLVNAKFTTANPAGIAPLVAHDAVMLAGDPSDAETALAARRAEALVCERVFTEQRPTRGCDDARALLALPDPLAALRDAGYE